MPAKTHEEKAAERQTFVDRLPSHELVYLIQQAAERLVLPRVLEETDNKFISSVSVGHRLLAYGIMKQIAENDRDSHAR